MDRPLSPGGSPTPRTPGLDGGGAGLADWQVGGDLSL